MNGIFHRVGINAPSSKVYSALSTLEGLSGWWTTDVSASSEMGGHAAFRFKASNFVMEVFKQESNARVAWRCLSGPDEWIGSTLSFELNDGEEETIVLFRHQDWRNENEFLAQCSMKWAVFLLSLKSFVETGAGHPYPRDQKIAKWS